MEHGAQEAKQTIASPLSSAVLHRLFWEMGPPAGHGQAFPAGIGNVRCRAGAVCRSIRVILWDSGPAAGPALGNAVATSHGWRLCTGNTVRLN